MCCGLSKEGKLCRWHALCLLKSMPSNSASVTQEKHRTASLQQIREERRAYFAYVQDQNFIVKEGADILSCPDNCSFT